MHLASVTSAVIITITSYTLRDYWIHLIENAWSIWNENTKKSQASYDAEVWPDKAGYEAALLFIHVLLFIEEDTLWTFSLYIQVTLCGILLGYDNEQSCAFCFSFVTTSPFANYASHRGERSVSGCMCASVYFVHVCVERKSFLHWTERKCFSL